MVRGNQYKRTLAEYERLCKAWRRGDEKRERKRAEKRGEMQQYEEMRGEWEREEAEKRAEYERKHAEYEEWRKRQPPVQFDYEARERQAAAGRERERQAQVAREREERLKAAEREIVSVGYKAIAQRTHPDTNPGPDAEEKMKILVEARDRLRKSI
jgi:hypothetical protein